MDKKISNMNREELQEFLDSFSRSVEGITESDIDRKEHLRSISKDGAMASVIVNSKNGQHESFRKAGQKAISENYDEWVVKVRQGGLTATENGIIQKTQYQSSQQLHKCDKCGQSGKGNLFKGLHFENCGKEKTFPQRYVFRMYHDGILVGEYAKLKDMASAAGRSLTNMSQIISGQRPSPFGWVFQKIDMKNINE